MNTHKFALTLATAVLGVLPLMAQQPAAPRAASTGGVSPHETTGAVIGDRRSGARVTITYGRPFIKNPRTGEVRKVWGGPLAPWGKAWRMGADEATMLTTTQPLSIGGATIPAGVAFTLYMIPEESGTSKLAISKKVGGWGVPVDESQDLARVELKKETIEKNVDQFTIAIERDSAGGPNGTIKITWENTQFSVPFTVAK